MADLEQRRQQYNSNLSRRQWEADPQGKLIETLGPLLEWLGQQHRAKDPLTPEEQAIAKEGLTQAGLLGSYLVPEVGIPANMVYEYLQMQDEKAAGGEPSAVPLALAALPMGALESRAGALATRGARAVQGAEKALGPAAVIGGPMLMAGSAHAGEASPDGGGADPVRAQYEQQLEQLNEQIAATTKRRDEEAADGGYGPKAKAADEQLNGLMAQQRDLTEKLRSYKSPDDLANLEGHRWETAGKGAAIGTGLALPFAATAYALRRKGVRDFDQVAGKIGRLLNSTPEALPGSLAGDKAFSLVNEAYRAGDAPAPFVRRGGGEFTPVSEIGGRRARASQDSEVFANGPHIPGSFAIPAGVFAEGVGTTAYGTGALEPFGMAPDTPEEAQMYQTLGIGSLGAATGFKVGKKIGEAVLPKAGAASRAVVNQARSRLEREMADAEGPGLWARLVGGQRGGSGAHLPSGVSGESRAIQQSEPPLLPGSPPRPAAEPQPSQTVPTATSQTASDVSSEIPGSLAPGAGAKKVKQPRPRKDAQGRLRDPMGQFTKPRAK